MKHSISLTRKALSLLMTLALLVGLVAGALPAAAAPADGSTVVLSCSDYQTYNSASDLSTNFSNMLNRVKSSGYPSVDGFLFCGDYTVSINNASQSTAGMTSLRGALADVYGRDVDEVYVKGNHDPVTGVAGISTSGAHDAEDYGVFVINEDDYMWYNNNTARIQQTAANLKAYLDAKRDEAYTKPIFVMSHLALHYSMRTYYDGDNSYANYLFDVLNEAGMAGLNIVFLFGHNHSNGWDDYLGGSAVFLPKGSSINIAQASRYSYREETLAFTYMNAGYVGYYSAVNTGVDATLTMCAFTIDENQVKVERYDVNGVHNLKAAGVANSYKNEAANAAYRPDTGVIASPQTIPLNKTITPSGTTPESPENPGQPVTGRVYTKVTSADQITADGRYLLINSDGRTMTTEVVTKSGSSGSRTGLALEQRGSFGAAMVSGEYEADEWTLTAADGGYRLGTEDGSLRLQSSSEEGIRATLEAEGDVFTLGGSADAWTFTRQDGAYVLNYNQTRGLINGYASGPATFRLYQYCPHTETETRRQSDSYSGDLYCVRCGSLLDVGHPVEADEPRVLLGDINEDGKVDLVDVSLLYRYVLEILKPMPEPERADVNADGAINLKDVAVLFFRVTESAGNTDT